MKLPIFPAPRRDARGYVSAATRRAFLGMGAAAAAAWSAAASLPLTGAGTARGSTSELTPIAGTTGWTRANNAALITATTAMKAGSSDVNVFCMGDSTTAGRLQTWTGGQAAAYPTQLATALNGVSIPASAASTIGGHNTSSAVEFAAYDPRWVFGTNWTTSTQAVRPTFSTIGSVPAYNIVADGVNTVAFANPENATDVKIIYIRNTGLGTFQYGIDVAPNSADVATAGTAALLTTSVTGLSSAAHTINIRKHTNTAGVLGPVGFLFSDTTSRKYQFWNAGAGSWLSDDWVSTSNGGYGAGGNVTTLGQNHTIINLGINDEASRSNPATTQTNLQTLITACKAIGTVWLVVPNPISTVSQATQDAYSTMILALGVTNSIPVLDLRSDFADNAAWTAQGYLGADGVHPTLTGYAYIAGRYKALYQAIYAAS